MAKGRTTAATRKGNGIIHIRDLLPDKHNARKHNARNVGMIERSLGEVGAARSIVIDEVGKVLAGNATVEAAAAAGIERVQVVDADGETIIAVRRRGLSNDQKRKLALYDNRAGELADWDADVLLAEGQAGLDLSGMFSTAELDKLLAGLSQDLALADAQPEPTERIFSAADAVDALWPSDNEWGVPMLDLHYQAEALALPVTKWGSVARSQRVGGTVHFYTDDYKFRALWEDPSPVLNARCVNAVEPNLSTNIQMPRAAALWLTFQKRWLARWWQSHDVRIFVDLNVESCFADVNRLGVPSGWRAFATRALESGDGVDAIIADYETACQIRGSDDVLFVVIGGNEPTERLCQERGWAYVPEYRKGVAVSG